MAPVDPRTDKLVRRTAMVGAATAAYFLLVADYTNPLDPIKKAMESGQLSLKAFFQSNEKTDGDREKESSKSNGKK